MAWSAGGIQHAEDEAGQIVHVSSRENSQNRSYLLDSTLPQNNWDTGIWDGVIKGENGIFASIKCSSCYY